MFKDDLLVGQKILVTGGGTGLGKSMSERLLSLGAEVVICGRREAVLAETAEGFAADHPGRISYHPCDIRDPAAIEKLLDWIWETGPLSGLINNAAGNFVAPSESLSPRALDAILNIVLHGTAYMTLACGRRWLAGRGLEGRGLENGKPATVLSILATYAQTGSGYVLPSAMAKAGILAMTRSLAAEWGGRGIRFNAVAPGPFPTEGAWSRLMPSDEFQDKWLQRIPLGRVGDHRELTDLIAYLMAEGSAYVNGEVITIDGGEWVKAAGQFNILEELKDEDWQAMRERPKA